MSNSQDAYPGAGLADDEAERISNDLPGQLARLRRQARELRDRLAAAAAPIAIIDPDSRLTARERAAASDD